MSEVQTVVRFRTAKHAGGFTLIELMVTITVLAILAVFAFPSFQTTIRNNRVLSDTTNLTTAINQARTEAVTRKQQVTICASSDGATCTNTATWSGGWIVFIDSGSKSAATVAAGDVVTLLRVFPKVTTSTSITATTGNAITPTKFIRFQPTGSAIANGVDGTLAGYTLKATPAHGGDITRTIDVGPFGRVQSQHS